MKQILVLSIFMEDLTGDILKDDLSSNENRGVGYYKAHNIPYPESYRPLEDIKEKDAPRAMNSFLQDRFCHRGPSIVSTILLVGGLVGGIIFMIKVNVGGGGGIMAAGYVLYLLINCCCNSTAEYLQPANKGENLEAQYQMIRTNSGRFQFHAECYHYEYRTYSDGNNQTTSKQKIVTHIGNQFIVPEDTQDISAAINLDGIEAQLIFVQFFSKYRFRDAESQDTFFRYFNDFKRRHTRDKYCNFSYDFKVNGVPERRAYYRHNPDQEYQRYYYGCNCIGCSLPFSCWLESKTKRYIANIVKVVKI